MPVWATIAMVAGGTALLVGVGAAGVLAWRTFVRRRLLRLVAKAEAVGASAKALADVLVRLAEASDEALEEFACDPESSERRALHEVTVRATMLTEELDRMPLPRGLIVLAEELGDAAYVVARESGRVNDQALGAEALDELSSVDLAAVRGYTLRARRSLVDACEAAGLDETVVYGGGLYL